MSVFLVTIAYREPTYRSDDKVYEFSWRTAQANAEDAVNWARREFDRMWELSSVGWVRDIVAITARPAA